MEANIDMNSNRLVNLVDAINGKEPATLDQLNGALAAAGSGLIASQTEVQTGANVVGSVTTFTGITYTVGGNNLFVFRNGNFQTKGIDYTETSSSSITWVSAPNSTDGLTFITNLATTNSTTDTSAIGHSEDGVSYNLATYLQNRHVANVKDFGAVGNNTTDDYAAIAAAYNSGASIVYFPEPPSGRYKIDTGLTPPNGVVLMGAGTFATRLRYTGTGSAITFGESSTVLNKGCGARNLKIELEDKDAKGLYIRGTEAALFDDILIEGLATYDNTRTNVGVHVDGANISSFFNMFKDVKCTHIHCGFWIQTTGTLQSTNQYFLNCSTNGDQYIDSPPVSADDASFGYRIGDGGSVIQEGQGSVISGGNVENVNTAFKIGNRAGNITIIGPRIEITADASSWRFDFVDGCDPCTLISPQGMGNSYMEANSGIRNWDSANHTLMGDENGSLRLAGFDGALNNTQFMGIGGTNPEIRHDEDSTLAIYSMGGDDKGRTIIHQGFGSATHGGFIDMFGTSFETGGVLDARAGDCSVGFSNARGSFKVREGFGGTVVAEVDDDSTAGNTRLLIWDVTAGTLRRVTVGAADSGGAGFKVLRISN